jgi:hypothetical protein
MSNSKQDFPPVSPEQRTSERQPQHEEIEVLAYNLYISRGAADGHALDDWLEAERELVAQPKPPARMAKARAV